MSSHYVILGNGPAGNRAALTLREHDPEGDITIISDENIEFYYKPRLTGYLAGKVAQERLKVRDFKFYEDKGIRLRLGQKVSALDLDQNQVLLDHCETVGFDRLIIAAGSTERLLPSLAPFKEHLKFITSYKAVMAFKDQIQQANEFFLLGGDLVGFRFSSMLRSMGKRVTMLLFPDAFWPFNLTDEMLKNIEASLSNTGTKVIPRDALAHVETRDGKPWITTRAGIEQAADLVFSFNGLIPRVDFAKGSGLDIDRGILVNEFLQTNVEHVYACGSCAQIYHPGIKAYITSMGWPNADIQGKTAALNLLGESRRVESAPRKYFDLEGVQIKTAWWDDIDSFDI